MITIFSCPKSFEGHTGVIQRNAIKSWLLLKPDCEIILIGDDDGVADASVEFGIKHIPGVEKSEMGTPLISSIFNLAASASTSSYLCYINSDIMILERDVSTVLGLVHLSKYLMVARRREIDLEHQLDFTAEHWREALLDKAGDLGRYTAIDLMLFPRNKKLLNIPPFSVGRPAWDNWFLYNAWENHVPIVDASSAMTILHQNHEYGHVPAATGHLWEGPEGDENRVLAGGDWNTLFTILDSTHIMDENGLHLARSKEHLEHRLERMQHLHPILFKLLPSWKLRYLMCWLFSSL